MGTMGWSRLAMLRKTLFPMCRVSEVFFRLPRSMLFCKGVLATWVRLKQRGHHQIRPSSYSCHYLSGKSCHEWKKKWWWWWRLSLPFLGAAT